MCYWFTCFDWQITSLGYAKTFPWSGWQIFRVSSLTLHSFTNFFITIQYHGTCNTSNTRPVHDLSIHRAIYFLKKALFLTVTETNWAAFLTRWMFGSGKADMIPSMPLATLKGFNLININSHLILYQWIKPKINPNSGSTKTMINMVENKSNSVSQWFPQNLIKWNFALQIVSIMQQVQKLQQSASMDVIK